jgi:hypothetical protein
MTDFSGTDFNNVVRRMRGNDAILNAPDANSAAQVATTWAQDDPNLKPFWAGGSAAAYNAQLDQVNQLGQEGYNDPRITPDESWMRGDRNAVNQSMGQAYNASNYYRDMANGQGVNAGANAYLQGMGNANAAQQSMAAGARGGAYNRAAASRLAGQNIEANQLGSTNALAGIDAQRRMQGMAGLQQMGAGMRGIAQGQFGAESNFQNAKLAAGIQQRQQDDAARRYYTGLAHQMRTGQQNITTQGIDIATGRTNEAQDAAMRSSDRGNQMAASLVGTAGQLIGAGLDNQSGNSDDGSDQAAKNKWGF